MSSRYVKLFLIKGGAVDHAPSAWIFFNDLYSRSAKNCIWIGDYRFLISLNFFNLAVRYFWRIWFMSPLGGLLRNGRRCLGLRSWKILQWFVLHVWPQNGRPQGLHGFIWLYVAGKWSFERFWAKLWLQYVTPIMCAATFSYYLWSNYLSNYTPTKYDDYEYPPWGEAIGMCMALSSIICIPVYLLIDFIRTPGATFSEVTKEFSLAI